MTGKRILVVDDDPHLRDVVVYTLEREGFQVTVVSDGKAALAALLPPSEARAEGRPTEVAPFDLVVLDILMPEVNGLDVCRTLRAHSRVPVLFLSSRDEELDKVIGLELGGDDYVTKPFSPRELAARVRALLRRVEAAPASAPVEPIPLLRSGPITLDSLRREVFCDGQPVRLTATEFGLLAALLERPGHVLSRGQLMERAYRYDNLITERTIDTHVKRIRKKFRECGGCSEPVDPIETVHGIGYKLRQ